MRVRINLSTKPQLTHRRFLVVAGAIGIVAGLFFLGLGWHVYAIRKVDENFRTQSEDVRRKLAVLEAQRADLQRFFALPENARLHERSAFFNNIIDARSLNWTQMFMDLEHIMPAGVHLISIEPKQEKGRLEVHLTVGATSDEAELKFLRALETSKQFSGLAVGSVRPPSGGNGRGGDITTMELTAQYSRI
ncbi:MAG: hypothetical protein NVS9B13_26200 [Candidatus Acidiferrum sp.]